MMHKRLVILVIALAWVACGPSPEELEATAAAQTAAAPTPIPDPVRGQEIFETGAGVVGLIPCGSCHHLDIDDKEAIKAPGLLGIADRAATRVPGLSAEEYIRQSILDPDAYYVERSGGEDWQSSGGITSMPSNYGELLGDADINDIVAYLLTQ